MINVLSETKKQQVIALGRLGWPVSHRYPLDPHPLHREYGEARFLTEFEQELRDRAWRIDMVANFNAM
jgi:hypothetical protein